MDNTKIFFALSHWGEFGQIRYQEALVANEQKRITLNVPAGRKWAIIKYRFGDITADTLDFRFDGILNYFEQNILIGAELLSWVVEPEPYLVAIGTSGSIVVTNTTDDEQDFSIVLDFYVIDDEIQGKVREFVYANREGFREKVTKQAGTGGA